MGETSRHGSSYSTIARTLYLFMKDMNGRSACSGTCATYWPPLMNTGKLTVGPGVKRALVGRTKRADGRLQVTYNKHSLYTFALDKRAGKTPTTTTTDTTDTTATTTYPSYP
jgi:predicted lipoprotein with Yx(FWY)xxD motif